ncbi:hypothetical protein MAR_018088 [Mya arenaria]|uniref:Tyrosine-protein phosphatase domain-containing protein n=1 Tax=Mya arenaria TaxID=6604 RepID=A0ABY7EE29_MYAAR|nr:hypothetical protein MAR_018088 [Mya arenaria]
MVLGNKGILKTACQKYTTVNISGFKSEEDYMLCSAPKPDYVNQFWTMVFAEAVDTIVMFAGSKTPKTCRCGSNISEHTSILYPYEDEHLKPKDSDPFVVLDMCLQQLTNGSLTQKVDVYEMLVNIVKTRKDLLPSQELFILTHDCVRHLGGCDYAPLQSSEEIESVYQTLQVND